MEKNKVYYEARLNRNITRITAYNIKRTYKKGTVIDTFSEKLFNMLTVKNISNQTNLSICEGHGVYEYFDLEKDIEFMKVTTTVSIRESIVKLKKK